MYDTGNRKEAGLVTMAEFNNVLIGRIKTAKLTKIQKKIAEYFTHNIEKIGKISLQEVSGEIGVSDASIIRFSRSLGYDGYASLKADVYNSIASKVTGGFNNLSLTERLEDNVKKSDKEDLKAYHLNQIEYNITRTLQQNSSKLMDDVVSSILRAKHCYIVGFRGCMGVAMQLSYLLRFIIKHVVLINDVGSLGLDMLQDIDKDDILIFIGVKRYYKSDVRIVDIAHEKKATVCLILDSAAAPFVKQSDLLLLVEDNRTSFFNSMMGIEAIIEYMVSLATNKEKKLYKQRAAKREERTKTFRLSE